MKLILSISLFLLFFSCSYVDIGGLFYSSDVNDRFNERESLKDFKAPDVSDDDFSFIVITDTHYYQNQSGYLKQIEENREKWDIDFVIITGDVVQNGLKESYDLYLEDLKNITIPVYTVIGNHDIYNNGYDIYKKVIGRTVYDFMIGKNQFIFLDTANGTLGNVQKKYLEDTLERSDAVNKIVFSHYSLTDKELQSPTALTYPEECYYLFDLFEKYVVDYFISGHLHFYDKKEIKGVKYIIVENRNGNSNYYLKVTIKNNVINHTVF